MNDDAPMDPAVREFFVRHASTGEPSALELDSVGARLEARQEPRAIRVVPRPDAPSRRRVLPLEVLAVAAVVVVSVAGGVIAVVVRAPDVGQGPAPEAASPLPPGPGVEPSESLEPGLPEDEGSLLQLARLRTRRGEVDGAIAALTRCLAIEPRSVDCTALLASAHARRAQERSTPEDSARARALYERFLLIAPPDDRRVAPIRAILRDSRDGPRDEAAQVDDLLASARALERTDADRAASVYEQIIERWPGSIAANEARARLRTLDRRPVKSPRARLMKVVSHPLGAEIVVDGKPTGRRTPVTPTAPLELAPGRHRLEFVLRGRQPARVELDVPPGDLATLIRAELPEVDFAVDSTTTLVEVQRGQLKSVRLDTTVDRFAVSDDEVVDVRLQNGRALVFRPLMSGDSVVVTWDSGGARRTFLVRVR